MRRMYRDICVLYVGVCLRDQPVLLVTACVNVRDSLCFDGVETIYGGVSKCFSF